MEQTFFELLGKVVQNHQTVKQATRDVMVSRELHKLDHEDIGKNRWYCGSDRFALCIRKSAEGTRLCKVYYGMGTAEDRADVLGCVSIFKDFSILASMLSVIRGHVCVPTAEALEIVFREELPEDCKTDLNTVVESLLAEFRFFQFEDVKTGVFDGLGGVTWLPRSQNSLCNL